MFRRKHPGKLQSSLTAKILRAIEYLQRRWATFMQDKASRLSRRAIKRWFAAFLLVFVLANTLILYHALTHGEAQTRPPVQLPPITPHGPPPKEPELVFTPAEKNAIQRARHLLDSMGVTPEGKARLDEFLSTHRGFADSLARAEQLVNH